MKMQSSEIRNKFLKFFEKRGHAFVPSASLVTTTEAGAMDATLFNTAGMQPFVPYLLGEPHPMGVRLVNVQKCLRTIDLSEVGDTTHNTFFEMMGNWSLGDYFKKDAITWSYEFLTSKVEGLGLDVGRLYVTVFAGSEKVERDNESVEIWKSLGIPEHRIYYKSSKSNWWSAGLNSPAGPSTEMFYDITGKLGDLTQEEFEKNEEEQKVIEIWNDVFMSYRLVNGKIVGELPQKNIDTGAGLERITTMVQGKRSVYETDLFLPIIKKIEELSGLSYGDKSDDEYIKSGEKCFVDTRKKIRIVADHVRTAVFIIADGVLPSNTGRGYILRRIIRRAVRYSDLISLKHGSLLALSEIIIEEYKDAYPELLKNIDTIKKEIEKEENKFRLTLELGIREFGKGADPFILFTTYGFPIELTEELAKEKGIKIDLDDFKKKMEEHQKLSQTSSAGIFKGGLANHNEKTIKLHTAHHLLLAGLQAIVSPDIRQRGSNITEERLRMDFVCDHKLTDEEKQKVENWVNDKIQKNLNVICREMPLAEAEKIGAQMEFGAKYPETVSIYFIEDKDGNPISKEFCGGPHVSNTSELGHFKIQKEEAVASGIRRIKAILV
ncbi:MAG: alanine--tRNA ligase [Candidatus Paceibacterota bacterium]